MTNRESWRVYIEYLRMFQGLGISNPEDLLVCPGAPDCERRAKYRMTGPLADTGYIFEGRDWVTRVLAEVPGEPIK